MTKYEFNLHLAECAANTIEQRAHLLPQGEFCSLEGKGIEAEIGAHVDMLVGHLFEIKKYIRWLDKGEAKAEIKKNLEAFKRYRKLIKEYEYLCEECLCEE